MALQRQPMNIRSAARMVLITLLLLSTFTALKSFVGVYNVEQWSNDIQRFIMREQTRAGNRAAYAMESYQTRLEAIQKQWTSMRYVSIVSCLLCCVGITFLIF